MGTGMVVMADVTAEDGLELAEFAQLIWPHFGG